jgi:hypothetical protein
MALHEIEQGSYDQFYTEDDFMHGRPEALLVADEDPQSVSVEYEREKAARVGVEETLVTIEGRVAGRPLVGPQERAFYYVSHPIPKTQDPGLDAKNFELCADGYYPVLLGENSYRNDPTKTYLGFAATRREILII